MDDTPNKNHGRDSPLSGRGAVLLPDSAVSSSSSSSSRRRPSGRTRDREEEDEERETKRRRVENHVASQQEEKKQEDEEDEEEPIKDIKTLILKDLRSDDEATIAKALEHLADNHFDNDNSLASENREDFFVLGGHSAALWVMEKRPDSKEIQAEGVALLVQATCDCPRLQNAIGKTDGIKAILSAMKRFQDDEDQNTLIIHNGFRALCNLSLNKDNAKILVEDALPVLLKVMTSFQHEADIIEHACLMLESCARLPNLREAMIEASTLSTLSEAILNHRKNREIKKAAKKAMTHLLYDI
jgi:hypothetical protein